MKTLPGRVGNAVVGNWITRLCTIPSWLVYLQSVYLISVPFKGGLADTIIGIVTQFLFALLTDRAFLRVNLDFFDDVFLTPNINLNASFLPPVVYQQMWNNGCNDVKENIIRLNNLKYYIICTTNNYTYMNYIYSKTNFSTFAYE